MGPGVTYETILPLRCAVVAVVPGAAELAALNADNEDLLRTLSVLEEFPPDLTDEHPDVVHELRRIDFKLNLVLELVSQVLARELAVPERVRASISAAGMEWHTAGQAPAVRSYVALDLYMHPRYPRALRLLARVQAVHPDAQGTRVAVVFEQLSESVSDWLTRIVFVHHRRQVALARRGHGASD